MLPTRNALHPAVERLDFGEGKPNPGEGLCAAEWNSGQRIGIGTVARSHESRKRDRGGRKEGCILVQEFMSEPEAVIPVEDSNRTAIGSILPEAVATDRTIRNLNLITDCRPRPKHDEWLSDSIHLFRFHTPTTTP